jgi:hypothetical protein
MCGMQEFPVALSTSYAPHPGPTPNPLAELPLLHFESTPELASLSQCYSATVGGSGTLVSDVLQPLQQNDSC